MDNELIENIRNDLRNSMSEYRYNHSINVMKKTIELARIYNVDENEAALAGLCHDIAKELSLEESLKIAEENKIEFDEIEKLNPQLMHGKIGAYLVKDRYNMNENIQNAIKFHTITDKSMNMLAKIVFVADKIEEGRTNEGISEEAELAKKDIDKAIILIIDNTIKYLLNENKLIHTKEVEMRNYLMLNGGQNGNI